MDPSEHERLFQNFALWAPDVPRQRRQWVTSLDDSVQRIVAGEHSPSVRTVFWVRLWGTLVDLRQSFARFEAEGANPEPAKIAHALRAVADCLSEDDLLWAEYRRHTETHVEQTAFRLQATRKGQLKEDLHLKTLGRSLPVEEIDARLVAFFAKFGDEFAIAKAIASKVQQSVAALHRVLVAWELDCAPTDERLRGMRSRER